MFDHERITGMLKRQQVLADFGEFALESQDLDEVLNEACRLVADVLGTGRSKILEIQNENERLFVRAGLGWDPSVVGHLHLPMSEHSSETFAIGEGRPVITQDISKEERFTVPEFMKKAGVVALVNAPIFLPGKKPYGLLQVDATEPRDFSDADTEFLRTYTIILGPVIDRLHKVRDLRTSEDRFRLVVERALDYAIYMADARDVITDWLPGAACVFGWTAEEARREGWAPNVRWHVRKDGSRIFIEGSTTALHDERGTVQCFLKIGQNVTERRETEEALRESEERFRQFADASSDVLWIRNAETLRFEYVGPAFERIYGVPPGYVREGDGMRGWLKLILPQDRSRALEAFRAVRAGEATTYEFRIRRLIDGEERWVENTDFPLFDGAGRVQRVGGIGADITELKTGQERQEVLINELQHRSRNLLGVLTSVANRTLGFAGLGGATLDNEENYLIKKLFTAMGAIQIENQARI